MVAARPRLPRSGVCEAACDGVYMVSFIHHVTGSIGCDFRMAPSNPPQIVKFEVAKYR